MNRKKLFIASCIAFVTIISPGIAQAKEGTTTEGNTATEGVTTPGVNTSNPQQVVSSQEDQSVKDVAEPVRIMFYAGSIHLKNKEEIKIPFLKADYENQIDFDVNWKSSNEKVATVDQSGLVKAVGSGKTKIRTTLKSNPKVFEELTVVVDGITVSYHGKYEPALNIGDEIVLIEAGNGSYYDEKKWFGKPRVKKSYH